MAEMILVVDDDINILELVEMSLTSDGFDVLTAQNGLSALKVAKTHIPDLILLDLMMPQMDGLEVMSKLKADSQTRLIPVIILTAHRTDTDDKVHGLTEGADDYITKPFDLGELTARVKAILGRTQPTKHMNSLIGDLEASFSGTDVKQLASHLRTAATIQQKLLPQVSPNIPPFDIAGLLRSSMSVSGDFYDFIPLDGSRLGITIADVRGKGIPAALLMVMIRTALRLVCREESSPASILKRINDLLAVDTDPDFFATMVYGILDADAMTFTYSNAGHCYPIHLKSEETASNFQLEYNELNVGGLVLGSFDFAEYQDASITLERGDIILFYTDGVTETEREVDGTFYGQERLPQILRANTHLSAETICHTIETDVRRFSQTQSPNDDLTLVVIKVANEQMS